MPNVHRQFKDNAFSILARLGSALSSPKRLELLNLLEQAPKTVELLAREAQLSVANASQHLKALKTAGLVASQKSGLYVEYRLAGPAVESLLAALERVAGTLYADLRETARQYYEANHALEAIDAAELQARLNAGDVLLIDVRPAQEYRNGHIEGAVNVPLEELPQWARHAPKDRPIVAYCRGPYCVLSVRAVDLLKQGKRDARRLADGVRDWSSRGFKVATLKTQP